MWLKSQFNLTKQRKITTSLCRYTIDTRQFVRPFALGKNTRNLDTQKFTTKNIHYSKLMVINTENIIITINRRHAGRGLFLSP